MLLFFMLSSSHRHDPLGNMLCNISDFVIVFVFVFVLKKVACGADRLLEKQTLAYFLYRFLSGCIRQIIRLQSNLFECKKPLIQLV